MRRCLPTIWHRPSTSPKTSCVRNMTRAASLFNQRRNAVLVERLVFLDAIRTLPIRPSCRPRSRRHHAFAGAGRGPWSDACGRHRSRRCAAASSSALPAKRVFRGRGRSDVVGPLPSDSGPRPLPRERRLACAKHPQASTRPAPSCCKTSLPWPAPRRAVRGAGHEEYRRPACRWCDPRAVGSTETENAAGHASRLACMASRRRHCRLQSAFAEAARALTATSDFPEIDHSG